jgi:preprotein translocase subunit SecG
MGEIIVQPSTGGGGGDATAANQATQITEAQNTNNLLTDPATAISVFVDSATSASVFIDTTIGISAFLDQITQKSAFINQTTGKSALNELLERQEPTVTSTVIALQNATSGGLAAAVQTNLRANAGFVIMNISYLHEGGATPWHAFITYR